MTDPSSKQFLRALVFAAQSGNIAFLQAQRGRGVDLTEVEDSYGWTLLHHAACVGQMKTCQFLVECAHCDPKAKNNKGETPVQLAEFNDQNTTADYLRMCVPE